MLYRLVRPMRRKESSAVYFVQRIPADVRQAAIGLRLTIPIGPSNVPKVISPKAISVRLSLRTANPSEVKVRQAEVAAYLETVWEALRHADRPVSLTHRQATALAGDLYRAWANPDKHSTISMEYNPETGKWERGEDATSDEWAAVLKHLHGIGESEDYEKLLGPLVDRLLLAKGIATLDAISRSLVLQAFWQALQDAFESQKRNAEGDYSPDPKASRFPEWQGPHKAADSAPCSLTGLVEGWWREAAATGRTISTYESYSAGMRRFAAFLGHDDAMRVSARDVIRYKDARLLEVSAKTVKDSDLAGLKTIFGWAVSNHRIASNPCEGVTLKLGQKTQERSKGFTQDEAAAVLSHAGAHRKASRELHQTWAAKRWVPWLCAYSGARLGEIVQLRKEDVREDDGGGPYFRITPEAGRVKDKKMRDIPIHPHLIELGFLEFVKDAREGYLFMQSGESAQMRGRWRTMKNRVTRFVREVVTDKNVAPNHAWRHLFRTISIEAGIEGRVIDAICGHAPRTVGESYGEVTLKAKANAMERFPRYDA